MNRHQTEAKEFYTKYYKQLVGATVTGFELVLDEFENETFWPTFTMTKDGETFTIEVSQDEEGNGAGFLFGLPDPNVKITDDTLDG